MIFTPKNPNCNTSPIFEALVAQSAYVGIWVCDNEEDGLFYEVDFNYVGHMSPEEAAKPMPPRKIERGAGWFEDGLSRDGQRKPTVYTRTYEEAMKVVLEDIAEHKLHEH